MTRRVRIAGALYLALVLPLGACSSGLLRGYAEGRSATLAEIEAGGHAPTGATRFTFDDLGSLNTDAFRTHAFPWKVLVAALLLHRTPAREPMPTREEDVLPILQEFGLFVPESVPNAQDSTWPDRLTFPSDSSGATPSGTSRPFGSRW